MQADVSIVFLGYCLHIQASFAYRSAHSVTSPSKENISMSLTEAWQETKSCC